MYGRTSINVHQASDGRQELDLDGDVNVFSASQLHQEAVRVAESGQDVVVCCEHVDSFDASALQILVALQQVLATQGKTFQLRGLSEQLLGAMRLTGLAEQLGDAARLHEPDPPETTSAPPAEHREV